MSEQEGTERPPEEEPTVSEQIGESIRSEDEPIQEPAAPFGMVMWTYPVILITLLLILAAYFFWFRAAPDEGREDDPARPAPTAPAEREPTDPRG